eukprot:SAG31_NODE_27154_length_430_cov_1.184290_2_plen_41_part_01
MFHFFGIPKHCDFDCVWCAAGLAKPREQLHVRGSFRTPTYG